MNEFGIHIEDDVYEIPKFAAKQNQRSAELHEWQKQAIDFFIQHNLAIFEASTGTGKTRVAIELVRHILKKEPNIKILVVVPKNVILEDGWYKEFYNHGFSLKDVGVFYGGTKEIAQITLTNVQNILKLPYEIFDFCIVDEVHNIATKRLERFIDHKFKYLLGLSATIERIDKAHLRLLKRFDYHVFRYTPKQALDDNVLNAFNFFNISVIMDDANMEIYNKLTNKLTTIFRTFGGYERIMRMNEPDVKNQMLALLNERKMLLANYPKKFFAVKKILMRHRDGKIIVFNNYNSQTNKCYWECVEAEVPACIVHSGVKKEMRDDNLQGFRTGKYSALLTTKILDEGYNLPSIDVGVIMAGDSTDKQTIQRMGRVLRKKENPSNLYQIYVKNTVEEDYAYKRAKIFKALCTEYNEYTYDEDDFEW